MPTLLFAGQARLIMAPRRVDFAFSAFSLPAVKKKKKKKPFHNRLTKALRSSFLPTSHPYFFFVRFTLPHPRKKFPPTPNINFLALSAHSKAAHATFPVSRHALIWLQSSRVAGKYQTKWCSWDQLHDRKWRFNSGTYVAAYSRSYFSACLQAV